MRISRPAGATAYPEPRRSQGAYLAGVIEGPYFYGNPDGPRVYDIAPDGRFLLLKPAADSARESLVLVEHWDQELKRLVP